MTFNVSTGAASGHPTSFDRGAAVTRSLLGYGIVVGPFYLGIGLAQALVRDGFAFARHPLSVLVNGPGGWVQTLNFVLSGAMVAAAAVGFARVLGPRSRGVTWCLAAFGVSMILAAMFPADPVDGFPDGTPLGPPTSITTIGMLHFLWGTLGFVSLAVSALFASRVLSRRSEATLSRVSLFTGLAVLIGFVGGFVPGVSIGTLGIWFAVVVGFGWIALIARHLYRVSPNPNCNPQR